MDNGLSSALSQAFSLECLLEGGTHSEEFRTTQHSTNIQKRALPVTDANLKEIK